MGEGRRAVTGREEMRTPRIELRERPTGRDRRTGVTKAIVEV